MDVGCGVGRHSIELAKRGYKVTGIEISQGML
ncbi:bifunctional 2-polyprenyl-6-hydroxyphenol methylase/3-demethylubiquinol 3-O-methyltransferase UbiG, partial [Thermococcus sp. Bubb.Bath]